MDSSSDGFSTDLAVPAEGSALSPLQKYIPREFLSKLETARASETMAGERRVVTMLFCDLKGSTAAAERLDPEEWTEIINGAFEYMITPVYAYEGTVARLMGDAILAFFGAPITHEDDPQRAVLAGLDILAGITPYREQVQEQWGVDINVRVGINTGLVVVGAVGSDLRMEYTAMGDAINLAARMEQTATPGSIQIAHDTYKIVKPLFDVEELGGIAVKGKEEKVPAYRVLGRKAISGRQRGIEGLKTVMVGRERELQSLKESLTAVQQGVGRIVTIIGEAGLGKSRMVREAKRTLTDYGEVAFFETGSLSYESGRTYGLFQRFIRRQYGIAPTDSTEIIRGKLATHNAKLEEAEQKRVMRVFEALFNLKSDDGQVPLEGEAFKRELFQIMPLLWQQRFGQQPTALVFDDIHWSDPASIELLIQLMSLTAEIPLVLICLFRPDRNGPVWRLRTKADEIYHHRYTEILLHPLPADQVSEMINNLLSISELPDDLYQRIQERAAGIPFFIEEVVRSLIDSGAVVSEDRVEDGQTRTYWRASGDGRRIDIPDSLQSLLAARIDLLQEETRQILQMASVIGRSFYQRVLLAIDGRGNGHDVEIEQEIGRLLKMEMIHEAARMPELEYKFSNPLTQEVAYQTILLKQRREFHRQVAEAIELLFPEQLSELASQMAFHFREAGEFAQAIRYFAMAGEDAYRLYANREAINHFDEALELLPKAEVDNETVRAIYTTRGRALELISDYQAAIENYAAMESEADRRNDDRLLLGATIRRTVIHSTITPVFDASVGLPLAEKALALADQLDEQASKAEVLWSLMLVHSYVLGELDKSIQYGLQALELCRTWNLETRLPFVLNDLGRVHGFTGQIKDGLRYFREARPLFEAQNNLPLVVDNSNGSSLIFMFAGKLEEALAHAHDATEISRQLDNEYGIRDSISRVNSVQLEKGELGPAIAQYEEQLVKHYEEDGVVVFALPNLAIGYTSLGYTSAILERYQSEQHRAKNFGQFFRDFILTPMVWLYALEDCPEQAAEIMAQFTYDARIEPFIPIRAGNFLATAQLLLAQGQYDEVISLVERITKTQLENELNYFFGDFVLLQAQALLAVDPPQKDEARRVLQEASTLLSQKGINRVLWHILAVLADLVPPEEAQEVREEAWKITSRIAQGIEDVDLRRAFLNHPDLERVVAAYNS